MKFLLLFLFSYNLTSLEFKDVWRINKDHSKINFEIGYLLVSKVTGTFNDFRGRFFYNEKGELVKLRIDLVSSSIDTGNKIRDDHLKKKDFFYVKKYNAIKFESETITAINKNKYIVKGNLFLKGVNKKTSFKIKMSKIIKDTWSYENRFINFSGEIKRSDFGINWNKTIEGSNLLIGDQVKIFGQLQLQPIGKLTPSIKHKIPDTEYLRKREKYIRGEIGLTEFNEKLENHTIKTVARVNKEITLNKSVLKNEKIKQKKAGTWSIGFVLLSFFGFIGALFICFKGKIYLSKIFSKSYEEENKLGIITDLIIYTIFGLFIWTVWTVGYA